MARRIGKVDVYAVAGNIAKCSDIIERIECDPGSSTYSRSWTFTFYLVNGKSFQHSFWNLSLLSSREAFTFLRGMAHMVELTNKFESDDA